MASIPPLIDSTPRLSYLHPSPRSQTVGDPAGRVLVQQQSQLHQPMQLQLMSNKDESTVHLYNVPAAASDGYLLDLCSRWGPVLSISRQSSEPGATSVDVVIVFDLPSNAKEALRHLDGGTLFGAILRAQLRSTLLAQHLKTFSTPPSEKEEINKAAGGPRNLYVLNLSLEMTNAELERLFSVFGPVTHVCIMAVLDNLGRRRAFVDMATGEAARQAIASLTGTTVHGYRLDISFAIVQRSGGPVTDYPPSTRKRIQQASFHVARNPQASASAYVRHQIEALSTPLIAEGPLTSSQGALVPWTPSLHTFSHPRAALPPTDQATIPARQRELYVANLDPVAIVDDDDLARLFMPYGIVLSAKLAVDANGHSMGTGVVKMSTAAEADMARTRIQGRVMDSKRIAVTFSPPVSSPQSMQQPLHIQSPRALPTAASVSATASHDPRTPFPNPYMQAFNPYSSLTPFWPVDPAFIQQQMHNYMASMSMLPTQVGVGNTEAYAQTWTSPSSHAVPIQKPRDRCRDSGAHFYGQASLASTHGGDNSTAFTDSIRSARANVLSPIHSREASVETNTTSVVGSARSSMDVKVEDATSQRDSEPSLAGSISAKPADDGAALLSKSMPASGNVRVQPQASTTQSSRSRSITTEGSGRRAAQGLYNAGNLYRTTTEITLTNDSVNAPLIDRLATRPSLIASRSRSTDSAFGAHLDATSASNLTI